MTISEDTMAVVEYLNTYTENALRKKEDVAVILELAALENDADAISRLSFAASSMWKVFALLRRSQRGAEGYDKLEEEFSTSMNEIRTILLTLSDNADSVVQQRFHEVYLGIGGGVIRNLTDLAHDFAKFKEMQNELKHKEN